MRTLVVSCPVVAPRRAVVASAACLLLTLSPVVHAQTPAEAIAELQRTLDEPLRLAGRPTPPGLAERLRAQGIPGVSIAVIHQGRIHWAEGFGQAREGVPMTAQTRLQAASISKPVSALGAMRLAARVGVAPDDDLRPRLKRWQPAAEADGPPRYTLRRLLSHTAGLSTPGFPGYATDAVRPTLPQILDGRAPANTPAVRPVGPAGERFRYSGGGTQIVQLWVEDETGRPFAEAMRTWVLDPLGMRDSDFRQPPPDDGAPRAHAHQPPGKPEPGGWRVYPEQQAAGLWTTPSDLARMLIAVQAARRGEVGPLAPAVARTVTQPVLGEAAMGFFIEPPPQPGGRARFGHYGSNQGFESQAMADLDGTEGVVVMVNSQGGGPLMDAIRRTLARVYGWEDQRAPLAVADQRLDEVAQRAVGQYVVAGHPTLRLRERDGALWVDAGPGDWQRLWRTEDGSYASEAGWRGLRLSAEGARLDGKAGPPVPRRELTPWQAPPLFLRGTMNDWQPVLPLQPQGGDTWAVTLTLPAGRHAWKLADAQWQQVDLGTDREGLLPGGGWYPLVSRGGNLEIGLDQPAQVRIELELRDGPQPPRVRWTRLP